MTDTATTAPADAGTPNTQQPASLRDLLESRTAPPVTPTAAAPTTGRIIDAAFEEIALSKSDARKHEMIYSGDNLAKNASSILSELMSLTLDAATIPQYEYRHRLERATLEMARTLDRYSGNRREFVASDRYGILDAQVFSVTKKEADQDRADDTQRELLACGLSTGTLQRDIDELYDELGISPWHFDDTQWRLIDRD